MRWFLVLFAVLFGAVAACDRPDRDLCTRACWNHYELTYRDKVEEEVAALPEAERDAVRTEKLDELAAMKADPDYGPFQACLENCRERGDKQAVTCWAEAETAEALEVCD
jgi:hypothetical protein